MNRDEIIGKLLYVPFNDDYRVNDRVKKLMTNEEFFEHCFIQPNFVDGIDKVFADNEINDFEIDIEKNELVKKLEKQEEEEEAFHNWIVSRQNDLYCIKGDAGTGKTTYLHYLQYHYRNSDINWYIIDMQKAVKQVYMLGNCIKINDFDKLYSKAISTIVMNISSTLFIRDKDSKKINHSEIYGILKKLKQRYNELFVGYYPRQEVSSFYKELPEILDDSIEENNERFAAYISNKLTKIISRHESDRNEAFEIILELYVYLVRCINDKQRCIIAFDNFERFINTCEIYNNQLTDFVCKLRETQNSMAANNPHIASHYQIVILMRNTSLRMFTSQQTAELIAHVIDLSGWFEAYAILLKKIEWYDKAGMKISGIDSINDILNDFGECRGALKGLHFKISMLFNYNKRVISYFLVRVLSRATNAKYIELYDCFWNKKSNLEYSLAKFAARSIIYRLILDELREDDFFKFIIVQKKCQERTSLGYARKILTILYDHYLNNVGDNGIMRNVYMSLGDIIIRLFEGHENPIMAYFDDNNNVRRKQIADVIYYMNYYDGRRDNWLQFVDLQYNIEEERVEIADSMQLNQLIMSDWQNIRLRITTAGKAYLFFMVYYFEYFACKSLNSDERQKVFGDNDIPPLLSAIPKINEILTKPTKELLCVKIIDVVSKEALLCISAMNDEGNTAIDFKHKINAPTISHRQRIVNSHRGYIDNFIECLNSLYRKEANNDSLLKEKLDDLILEIRKIRNKYRVDYVIGEK